MGDLRAEEIGIMFHILSNSDNWILNKDDIMKKSKLGKDRFKTCWNHLKELGYIVINKLPVKDGKFNYSYTIYEKPVALKPNTVDSHQSSNHNTFHHTTENSIMETMGTNNNHTTITRTTSGGVSNSRNEVEVRHAQKTMDPEILDQALDQKNICNDNIQIVPHPSLCSGSVRDIGAGQERTTSNEVPDFGPELNISSTDPVLKKDIEGSGWNNNITASVNQRFSDSSITSSNSISNFWPTKDEFEPNEEDVINFTEAIDDLMTEEFPNWKSSLKKKPLYAFLAETQKVHKWIPEFIEMIEVVYHSIKGY